MKFGKYLSKRHLDLPEYAQYFVDYKALKKLMKRLAALPAAENSEEARYERLQQNKSTFFFRLERELEKVTTFYSQKEAGLETRLDLLIQKRQAAASGSLGKLTRSSVAYISIHEGLQRFRRDLDRLEQFVELNATAFSKVLKKWDKQSRSHIKELYLSSAVEVQPMFHRDVLVSLSDKSNACMLEVEALAAGDSVVFEPVREQIPSSQVTELASDDLFNEFVSFATQYNSQVPGNQIKMKAWIAELRAGDDGEAVTRLTQVFLRAIPTLVSDDALMALWDTGLVQNKSTEEVASRTVLHLCAAYTSLSPDAAAERVGGLVTNKGITREKIFDQVLARGEVDINALDAYGRTPLIYATMHNRRDFLLKLLKSGALMNHHDNDNLTALHYSIFNRYLGCVEDLLDAGAQTGGIDPERQYVPLNFACQHGAYNAVVLLLKKRGKDPMIADAEGLYPLHTVARSGYASIIPVLVAAGASVNQVDRLYGWTPLMYAASGGQSRAVSALLAAGADHTILDEKGRSALFYAAWEGHTSCFKSLSAALGPNSKDISRSDVESVPEFNLMEGIKLGDSQKIEEDEVEEGEYEDEDSANLANAEVDMSDIPMLELPPPIMPLKRYGHNFLDAKKVIAQIRDVQIHFDKDRRGLRAGRLCLTSSSTRDSIPRNLPLPVPARDYVQTFEVDQLDRLSLTFEVMPTFGTRLLAKAVATPNIFSAEDGESGRHARQVSLSMLDLMLRPVGMLEFTFLVVKPYPGPTLDIIKYDTYWKSTAQQPATSTPIPTLSYVTASSLHGEHERIVVTLTCDLVPILMDMMFEIAPGVSVATPLFTFAELCRLKPDIVSLEQWYLGDHGRINIHLPFPTMAESRKIPVRWPAMNTYIDEVLSVVFANARKASSHTRSLVFSSTHPEICAILNWKQPNYPVFFCATAMRTDGLYSTVNHLETSEDSLDELTVCKSLREASLYAATNNIMGIIAPADILRVVPAVIPAIRATGLVLVADALSDSKTMIEGVDGVHCNSKLEFPRKIGM